MRAERQLGPADTREAARAGGPADGQSCIDVTAALGTAEVADQSPIAPWGVQLAGNFTKVIALASFERARQRYSGILGSLRPMIIGTRLRSRGTRPFYRVLLPASSHAVADQVCHAITARGGAWEEAPVWALPFFSGSLSASRFVLHREHNSCCRAIA